MTKLAQLQADIVTITNHLNTWEHVPTGYTIKLNIANNKVDTLTTEGYDEDTQADLTYIIHELYASIGKHLLTK